MDFSDLPWWKLKRELRRLWMQMGIPLELLKMPHRRRLYDAKKHDLIKVSQGSQPLRDNVAIALVFQPNGISKSQIATLKHLNANGFSPLVVSNCPLSDSDRAALCDQAYQVLERPNFGYDFGGYREGVLHLLDSEILPENLVLLNDSIWFPVRKNCDFLDRIKEGNADLYGVVFSERPGAPHRAHLQSYFYNFKKSVVQDPSFRQYWEELFFTENKFLVIRKCEMKLTQFFESRGYKIDWFCDLGDLQNALLSLSKSEIELVAKYQIKVDYKNVKPLREFLEANLSGTDWQQAVKRLVESRSLGKYILIAHPVLLFNRLSLPILKRDRQQIYQIQREELINGDFDDLIDSTVMAEIRQVPRLSQ